MRRSNHSCCGWCGNGQSQVSQNDSLLQQLLGSGRNGFLRLSLLAFDLLVLDRVEMNLTHSIHHVLVLKRDKSEPTVALRLLIHQHDCFLDLAKLTEILFDLFGRCVLRNASHEDLLGLVRLGLWSVLGRRMLGIDFLSIQSVNWHFENFVYAIWFLECDESESPAPLGDWILHDQYIGHFTEHSKILAELLGRRLPTESANEQLSWCWIAAAVWRRSPRRATIGRTGFGGVGGGITDERELAI